MYSEVQEVDLRGPRGKRPVERTERLLHLLKSIPLLIVNSGIWMMNPDTKLVVNVSSEVEKVIFECGE